MWLVRAFRGAARDSHGPVPPILRKAYHRKSTSPDMITDTVKLNGEDQVKNSMGVMKNHEDTWWVPDDRTGIFYPKGQEKVLEDVPSAGGKDFRAINWFSNHENYL
ncbi:unnamed protein product [Withania somnifera]